MGENKEKLSDVIRATGLARNTVAGLYRETTARIDIETLNALCSHYGCNVGNLLEYVPNPAPTTAAAPVAAKPTLLPTGSSAVARRSK